MCPHITTAGILLSMLDLWKGPLGYGPAEAEAISRGRVDAAKRFELVWPRCCTMQAWRVGAAAIGGGLLVSFAAWLQQFKAYFFFRDYIHAER